MIYSSFSSTRSPSVKRRTLHDRGDAGVGRRATGLFQMVHFHPQSSRAPLLLHRPMCGTQPAHIWGKGGEDRSPVLHMCSAWVRPWGHAKPEPATWVSLSARKAWQSSCIPLQSWISLCRCQPHICMTQLNSADLSERCCPYMLQSDSTSLDQGVYLRKYPLFGCLYILQ